MHRRPRGAGISRSLTCIYVCLVDVPIEWFVQREIREIRLVSCAYVCGDDEQCLHRRCANAFDPIPIARPSKFLVYATLLCAELLRTDVHGYGILL